MTRAFRHARLLVTLTTCLLLTPAIAADTTRTVTDDRDRKVSLAAPAQRIVALAPHITENLFAIGAGAQLVGTVSYSDYPNAAEAVPRIGNHGSLDMEKIIALKPDLILSWVSTGNRKQAERLEAMGMTVYYSDSHTFEQLASTFERIGHLTGRDDEAKALAEGFRARIATLGARHADAEPVTVFYQVWDQPLMTVSDRHLIAKAIRLCGGVNIFGDMDTLIPRISVENVLALDPDVIIAGGMGEANHDWLNAWKRWPELRAVGDEQLRFIPPSLLQRHTPRFLEGASMLCDALAQTRQQRSTSQ
ncbi:cobalamin-binding protein [Polycyclovorans algicola]|uniref:cobalamin-binding protein n=1 Tax=Polycyclovorans algicola TaxID=616992 RepID=UPI0004A6D01F|nr:cobalamin-binding protein [Polycyclovorans algicola]